MRAELARAVRAGQVHPRELVTEALRRIEAADGALNSVVRLCPEQALAEAERHPRTGPLAGLPLLVKDLARTVGMPTTMGSPLYADAPPDQVDDVVVARLKAAGAIVVGKTNTPAFGHTAVTVNQVFGATRNPWQPERSPGGSSGGSAAALAAGLAPLATTSDGGGSVRIPASLCGLVGYKPTNGAVGRNPIPRWYEFSTMGCTAGTVADVLVEAEVVLGGAAGDVIGLPRAAVDLRPELPTHIVACRTLRAGVDEVIGAAFDEACELLRRETDLPVRVVEPVTGPSAGASWFVMAATELAQSLAAERDRWAQFEPSLRSMVEFGAGVSGFDYVAAARDRWTQCARVDEALGGSGVLLTPTVNAAAWPAEGPLPADAGGVHDPLVAVNTSDFNFTGHPAVSVPLGRDWAGVPFGLQIVAPRCRDGLALGLARVWEQLAPWPEVAPGYRPFGLD